MMQTGKQTGGSMLKQVGAWTFVVFAMIGCSPGGSQSDDARAQQRRDMKALEDLYAGAVGKWEGTIANPDIGLEPSRAQLDLYMVFVPDGAFPDGGTKVRPSLRGRFRPVDFVTETDSVMLVGDYDRSGRLLLASASAAGPAGPSGAAAPALAASSSLLSIQGGVAGDSASLEVSRVGGVWGTFTSKRTSRTVSAPSTGETMETRARYFHIYGPLEGRYSGTVVALDGSDYAVEISMVLVENSSSDVSGTLPQLRAFFRRLQGGVVAHEWVLKVDYNSQTGQVVLSNASSPSGPSGGGGGGSNGSGASAAAAATLSVAGVIKDVGGRKQIEGQVRDRSSLVGKVTAIR